MSRPLSELSNARKSPHGLLSALKNTVDRSSMDAGLTLLKESRSFELSLRDYLTLAIDPRIVPEAEQPRRYEGLDGYEAALAYLNLPLRNDFKGGVVLEAASETFQTFPGTRALFPEVIDDMVRWSYRQDQLEQIAPILANSRTIQGTEVLTTVVNDDEGNTQIAAEIAEGSRIPVKSIRTSQQTVGIFKHGLGYRTTYEFQRRVRLDIMTPYANRAQREMERSKLKHATGLLVNGDTIYAAAPVVTQSSFGAGASAGAIYWPNLLAWLVSRAQLGVPIDTVVGNWDAYLQWLKLFAVPQTGNGPTGGESLSASGFQIQKLPISGNINFAISSAAPALKLIGMSRGDTLEELIEANSLIDEAERAMANQTITYYRTLNSGYRLAFGDTRSIYNFNA